MSDTKKPDILTQIIEAHRRIFNLESEGPTHKPIRLIHGFTLEYSPTIGFYRMKGEMNNLVKIQEAVRDAGMLGIKLHEQKYPDGSRYIADEKGIQRYFDITEGSFGVRPVTPSKPAASFDWNNV